VLIIKALNLLDTGLFALILSLDNYT